MAEKVFGYAQDGLSFEIRVFKDPGIPGMFCAEVAVISGFADFNAIWAADNAMSCTSATIKGALNMNGAEGSSYDAALSSGIAKKSPMPVWASRAPKKDTFFKAGETMTIKLDGVTGFDAVEYLGIRATSTSPPEGSIKTVDQGNWSDRPRRLRTIFRSGRMTSRT